MAKLDGKVAVVTGGSSGIIGLAVARRFAEEGAHVFITGRRQAELDAAATLIGARAEAVQGDATSMADLDRLYRTVMTSAIPRLGRSSLIAGVELCIDGGMSQV